jgi:hypothetical protein
MNVDFTTWQTWLLVVGIVAAIGGFIYAVWMRASVKGLQTGVVVLAVGVVTILVASFAAPTTGSVSTQPPPQPTASAIVSVNTAMLQTNASWAPATHTLTYKVADQSGKYYLCATNNSAAGTGCSKGSTPTFLGVPLSFARGDSGNFSAGFYTTINGIPTATPSGGTTAYSVIGYTAATSTSGGVWQISYSSGSLKGANPSQNAPSVASGLGPNLVGVGAFGTASEYLGFTLAGTNSTSSGFTGTGYAQYTTESFTIAFSGGAGATPAAITVDIILT